MDTHSFGRRNWTEHGRTDGRTRTLKHARSRTSARTWWTDWTMGDLPPPALTALATVIAAAAAVLYSTLSSARGRERASKKSSNCNGEGEGR